MRQQFKFFIQKVNQRGYALAIAHPYPKTIKFLKQYLPELSEQGIRLVPVSRLIPLSQETQDANQKNKQRGNSHVACTGPACSRL